MYASSLHRRTAEDSRDATFIRYDMLFDSNERRHRADENFVKKSYYGQLQNIFVARIPATQDLDLSQPEILILAGIRSCALESVNRLNMPRYSKLGAYEVVDMSCV
ncbi:hypothetical protein FIBSPDRAFT_1015535 [Athelia psychrophila]|uniref:Uncharacterized protein n=1 Tax=Athelia psychrophila TaxID=1759441 RepID=A0A166LM38_9AGAM|nr:hypothetical protein FIBSPDRAFT_1015535 [Fibularhizoctonia sp. CBS 109695]